jgi:hypothetical protein
MHLLALLEMVGLTMKGRKCSRKILRIHGPKLQVMKRRKKMIMILWGDEPGKMARRQSCQPCFQKIASFSPIRGYNLLHSL